MWDFDNYEVEEDQDGEHGRCSIVSQVTREIVTVDEMKKGAKKGTYACVGCLSQSKGNYVAAAVLAAGGTGTKQCLHARHYSKNNCNETELHKRISRSIKVHLGGSDDLFYPDTNFRADARVGNDFYEVVRSSSMSDIKRYEVAKMIEKGQIRVFNCYTRDIPKSVIHSLWKNLFEIGAEGGWEHYWYEQTRIYFKLHTPKKRKKAPIPVVAIGDNKVGHFKKNDQCAHSPRA